MYNLKEQLDFVNNGVIPGENFIKKFYWLKALSLATEKDKWEFSKQHKTTILWDTSHKAIKKMASMGEDMADAILDILDAVQPTTEPDPYWIPKYKDPLYLEGLNHKANDVREVMHMYLGLGNEDSHG